MPLQSAVDLSESGKLTQRYVSTSCKCCIPDRAKMPCRKVKIISFLSIRVLGIDIENVKIKGCKDIGKSERPAGMSGFGYHQHFHDSAAKLPRHFFQFKNVKFFHGEIYNDC